MRPVWRAAGALTAVVLVLVAASATLRARDRWYPRSADETRELYVTSGETIGTLALGFDAVLADVYWIRAVQHYGRDRRSLTYKGRYELLGPLVDITTTLDPHFTTAFVFGALFLAEPLPNGPNRLDLAVALLEKGLRAEPDHWQYAQYLGFLYYWHTGDRQAAARQFERAAAIPGAPVWLKPLAANMFVEGGDRDAARMLLEGLLQSEEPWIRDLARRKLQELWPS
jgi:tetratricopeptide (TPR) repeat protein